MPAPGAQPHCSRARAKFSGPDLERIRNSPYRSKASTLATGCWNGCGVYKTWLNPAYRRPSRRDGDWTAKSKYTCLFDRGRVLRWQPTPAEFGQVCWLLPVVAEIRWDRQSSDSIVRWPSEPRRGLLQPPNDS